MKLILTGTTGFIGQFILCECIKSVHIDQVYSITRRPLPSHLSNHAKVSEIIVADFESWPAAQLHALRDAGVTGCIWCLGGAITRFKDYDEATAANIALPITAAEISISDLADRLKQPF
jgi:nucleoside-diphosphate-sugar epimerase